MPESCTPIQQAECSSALAGNHDTLLLLCSGYPHPLRWPTCCAELRLMQCLHRTLFCCSLKILPH